MRALTLTLSLLLAAPSVLATDAPTHRTELLAWSGDGTTALIRETSTAPNGSGERALRLLSKRAPKRIVVSQIDDPNGKRPQKVSDKSCAKRLKALGKTLDKRGFAGVSVATTCEDRANLVTVTEAEVARAADTWFSGDGTQRTRDGLTLKLRDNVLELAADGHTVGSWPNAPQPLEMSAALSPSKSLIVVLYHWNTINAAVMAVLSSKTGLPADFKPTRP
ncbi:MAG: hypothetical protein QF464_06810 [Myxococcota bacterium]|nr:hypothetical protein [Myxococcota bacterium]